MPRGKGGRFLLHDDAFVVVAVGLAVVMAASWGLLYIAAIT